MTDHTDRLSAGTENPLRPDSLVGSFFHSGPDKGWQGCVVAEPYPGTYLIELFGWLAGDSTCQQLVNIDTMTDWQFYDTADWMRNAYEHGGVQQRWERLRSQDAQDAS
jgi:hypothetical protein